MKTFLKWGGVAILLAALLLFVGCPIGEDKEEEPPVVEDPDDINESGVDFKSYTGNDVRAFWVRNSTSKRLIAFRGAVHKDNILGGIPNNGNLHGIQKSSALLNGSQEFSMILITEDDYIKNKSNIDKNDNTTLLTLQQNPFTRVYVFYNSNGDNSVQYEISSILGGTNKLNVINNTQAINIEVRIGGIYGPTLGYAPKGSLSTYLYVSERELDLFPVFKWYNEYLDIVETIYPMNANNKPWRKPIVFEDGVTEQYFDVQEAIDALNNRSSGVARLTIINNAAQAIRLRSGDSEIKSPTGIASIGVSSRRTVTIEMPKSGNDSATFADSIQIDNYWVGPIGEQVRIFNHEGASNFWLQADYEYYVYVTGDMNSSKEGDGYIKAVVITDVNSEEDGKPVKFELKL